MQVSNFLSKKGKKLTKIIAPKAGTLHKMARGVFKHFKCHPRASSELFPMHLVHFFCLDFCFVFDFFLLNSITNEVLFF